MTSIINNFEITNDFIITDGNVQIKTNDTTGSLDVSGNIIIGSASSDNAKLIVKNINNSIVELKAKNSNNTETTKSITNKSGILEFTSNASLNTCLYEFNVGDSDSLGFMNSTGNNKPGIVFGRAGTGSLSVNDYSNAQIFYSTVDGGSVNNALNFTGEKLIFNTSSGNFSTLSQAMIIDTTGNIGMGTASPTVSLDVIGTDAIRIPYGTTAQRPQTDASGCIRYNTQTSSYEGFGAGSAWGSLGGVKDVDQDTYISAETAAGTDNDQLKFYTADSEKMIIDTNGRVGIGTSSPSQALHVIGSIQATTQMNATTFFGNVIADTMNGTITTAAQPNITSVGTLTSLTTTGNVGIGATSPSVPLEINRASPDNIAIFSRTDSTLVDLAFSGSNGYACMLANVSNNSYGIKIAAKHNSFPAGNQDDGIFVRADGNVGIGTNAPYSKLHVIKNLRVGYEYDSKAGIVLSDEDGFGGNYPNIQSITKTGAINNLTLNPVGGNVGIGTNSPTYPLQIKGGATSAKACQLMIENLSYNKGIEFRYKSVSGTTYDFPQAKIYTSGSSYDTKLHFSTAVGTTNANTTAVEVMTLDSAGNVGIGTNSPTYMLEVISEAQVSDPNFTPTYWYGSLYCGHTNGGITLGRIGPTHTNCIQSRYGGAGSSLAINPFGGNVGIGTTSPGDKLEVNSGNIILKGNTPRIKFYSNNGTYGNEILSNHSDSVNYGLQIYTPITSFWYSANYSYCSIQNRPNQDRPHGQFYLHYGYNNGSDRNVGVFLSASPSENNYINNGGNVGIGTNSPRATFNVSRNISNNSAGTTIPSNYGGNDTTTCVLGMGLPGSTQNYYGLNIGTIYNGDSYIQSCHINSSSFYSILLNPKGGNVGIGTTTATYTLNVGGDTMTSEWYRTNASGDQGWYSNTHGGGIYMSDSSWVRIYNKPCYISKSKNENFNGYYFSSGTSGDGVHYSNATSSVSLRTAEGIVGKWIGAYSDRRIKKNIEDINDSDALKLLRKIPVRYYNYKDEIMYGKERVSGFIAQEVKEIFPIAVSTAPYKNYIPSILKKITNEVWEEKINDLSDNEWILTNFDVIDTSGVVGPIDISSGTLYDFYLNDDENSIEEEKEVLADNNGNFIFKKKWENLYLYGICVNDFLILDKNKIFALNFSASQEIDRIQQAEKAKLEEQTTEIILLKNKIATLESQYYNLQQQVQTLIDNQ
jgi:hypothetical protein